MNARILVIDDEDNLRSMVRLALEASGYDVGEAADGEQGLKLFGDGRGWDCVLLDQRMPGMDGLDTLRHIRQRNPDARIVMLTAYPSIELAVDAMKLGATDFLRKPMTPEVLRRSVAAALAAPRAGVGGDRAGPEERMASLPIVRLTMNGFQIVRDPAETPVGRGPFERRFLVKSPEGRQEVVRVTYAAGVVRELERLTGRALPPESTFWTERAESRLAAHLWETAEIPRQDFIVESVAPDDVDLARRWGEKR